MDRKPTPSPAGTGGDMPEALARLAPRLRLRAVRLCGDRALAEDLVQDTLLRLLARHAAGEPPPRDLERFVLVALGNVWRDRMRRAGTARGLAATSCVPEPVEPCGPARRLAERSAWRHVAEALGRLPAEQRALLVSALAEPGGQGVLARRLGLPRGTLASRLARARRALRRETGLAPGEGASALIDDGTQL